MRATGIVNRQLMYLVAKLYRRHLPSPTKLAGDAVSMQRAHHQRGRSCMAPASHGGTARQPALAPAIASPG